MLTPIPPGLQLKKDSNGFDVPKKLLKCSFWVPVIAVAEILSISKVWHSSPIGGVTGRLAHASLQSILSVCIVDLLLFWIRQHIISFTYFFKLFLGTRCMILVRMVFEC